ncbi:MAG: hypothetical protein OXI51_07160 [Chloroflexota bacterium]|nr:hypothetical protein [Chloroflexota bacterium]
MTEPPRRRVPVAAEQSIREERRSFFRIAAILGVVIGIPLGVLGIPPLLNVFFDEPTIPAGSSWSEDGVTIWVEALEIGEGAERTLAVTFLVRTAAPWTFETEGIELELVEGDPIPVGAVIAPDVFEGGTAGRIVVRFVLPEAVRHADARAVRFLEPKVRFEIVESDH